MAGGPTRPILLVSAGHLRSAAGTRTQQEAIVTWEGSWNCLPSLHISVLILQGSKDVVTPPDNARIISCQVDGSVITEIKGCGHGLCYQEPERCAMLLNGFFEDGEEK